MKYFLPLVQERGAKIPAPEWEVEVVAPAAAAAAPPPPCLSPVLQSVFDCELRCSAPKVLVSDTSYLTCPPIMHTLAPQIPAKLLAAPVPLLSTTYTQKSKNKNMFIRETLCRSCDAFSEPVCM